MTLADAIQLALRNLSQAKLRTSLTVMGVSIGIASLAGMVSLGVGLQDQFVGRLMKAGVFDSITVMPASRFQSGPFGGGGRGGLFGVQRGRAGTAPPAPSDKPSPTLDDEAVKKLAGIAEVKEVYPNLQVFVTVKYEEFSGLASASGVPMSARDHGAFQTWAAGGFFANESDNACLMSLDLAKRLSTRDPKELIGKEVTLSYAARSRVGEGTAMLQRTDVKYTIAGIVEREPGPSLGGLGFSTLMIPLAKAAEISANTISSPQAIGSDAPVKRSYNSLTVKVKRAQFTQDVEDKIKEMGFNAFSLNDALRGAKRAFIILDIVLSLIGSIALAVSSLGIVNTMVMSILERTREIGIMKAIGGSDGDIRRIFLIEASVIGGLGGVAGIVLGWLVGRAINFGANLYIQSQGGTPGNLFALPLWLIGGALGFSIVVSLIAGSYPASRAARLDPIRALRHD